MATSFTYWDDCVDLQDLEAMWEVPEVRTEWLKAGEVRGHKVHLSRDPDGQPYLTQTEMRALADIVISRHFQSKIDPSMICAIAELESDRQLLVMRSDKDPTEATLGLMQLSSKTVKWLMSELGYRQYGEGDEYFLFRPFVNVYFGAACIKWLSKFDNKKRSEEFIVRAYKGGTKKAIHKSTLDYWKGYLSVKESYPSRKPVIVVRTPRNDAPEPSSKKSTVVASDDKYWDSRASPEDMADMWNHPEVRRHWKKSKEKRGKARFKQDENKTPYLSPVELKAVADIVLSKHFRTKKIKSTVLCAIGEVVSKRFVNGFGDHPGIMGIDYSTAYWIYLELGYRAYKLETVHDLKCPFVSMYFAAAYVAWLSEYEGRERTLDFVAQAYFVGPKKVKPQDNSPLWLNFVEALNKYEESKRNRDSCSIM
ncbi:PREDICTED: uncharacterized protein LOC109334703 [Lupinus angustifolius]|uniref:uncharacterized protein LOC109334703 n=1 Tax=Lupinus angustifolius TaxID=3871 RepID=UPI00092EF661|nr:PREDICTED: uncharacterized protein LOC109334703 [Lupinus angustifolius]